MDEETLNVYGMKRGDLVIRFENEDVDIERANKAFAKISTFIQKLRLENPEVISVLWERN